MKFKSPFICVLASLLVVLISGCGKNRSYEKLSPEDVLVQDGDVKFTKGDLQARLDTRLKLNLLRDKNYSQKAWIRLYVRLAVSSMNKFALDRAFEKYARENGIAPSDKTLKTMKDDFLKRVAGKNQTWSKLRGLIGNDAVDILLDDIESEALAREVKAHISSNLVNTIVISDEDVKKMRKHLVEYNARNMITNDAIFAVASNDWKRLSAGLKMEDLGVREHISVDTFWGAFLPKSFDSEPQVREALLATPIGGYTPPVEGDNGLMILKILDLERSPGHENDPQAIKWTLARVFYELPLLYNDETEEQIKARHQKKQLQTAVSEKIKQLVKDLNLKYPNGREDVIFPGSNHITDRNGQKKSRRNRNRK